MDERVTHRITIHLANGKDIVTEAAFADDEDVDEAILEEIEERDNPWKRIGGVILHFKQIAGFTAEEL